MRWQVPGSVQKENGQLNSNIRRLIAGVLLLGMVQAIWAFDSPTDEELASWWESLSRTERLAELRKLDEIEHAQPQLDEPRLIIIQTESGKIHSYFSGPLLVDIAGHLQYEITLPEATAQGIRKRNVWVWAGVGAGAGVCATIGFTLVLLRIYRD